MSRTVYTYNEFHLGDNLIFLHLLRALAKSHVSTPFVHFCHAHYHDQLKEVVEDIPNILLDSFDSMHWTIKAPEACNTWKNFAGHWEKSPVRWDWVNHTLDHHRWTALRMGFESPFTCREHLLFDYPKLQPDRDGYFIKGDFLIVNSEPSSGQFSHMAQHGTGYLDELAGKLRENHFVCTTVDVPQCAVFLNGTTISEIGKLSMDYRHHIMIATGPMWPTLNVHNHHNQAGRKRIVLLDNGERLEMPGIIQCANVEEVMHIARQEGWL